MVCPKNRSEISDKIVLLNDKPNRRRNFCCHLLYLKTNLHSPDRRLIELRIEHADLDAWIDRLDQDQPADQLKLRRLKKRRLKLKDEMVKLELLLGPQEPA